MKWNLVVVEHSVESRDYEQVLPFLMAAVDMIT